MPVYEADVVSSVIEDLTTATLTAKDPTGAAETVSGTLATLFPNINVYPVRMKDIENVPSPAVGVSWEASNQQTQRFYGEGSFVQPTLRLIGIGTVLDANANVLYDESIQQTMLLKDCLSNYYFRRRRIPWKHYTYNSGSSATRGEFWLQGEPQCPDLDGFHFIVAVGVEIAQGFPD